MYKYIIFVLFLLQLVYCKQPQTNSLNINDSTKNAEVTKAPQNLEFDTIRGFFNNDTIEDFIKIIKLSSEESQIKIFLGKNDKNFTEAKTFKITNDDFSEVSEALENFFVSEGKPGEIIIGASCCGNFKTTQSFYYRYVKNNWYLYKSSISTVDDDFIPNITIEMHDLSQDIDGTISNNKEFYDEEMMGLKNKNVSLFNDYLSILESNYKTKSLDTLNSIGYDEIAELLYFNPINAENVNDYNDIAFYHSHTKDGLMPSILLLKEITEKFPDRVVAYLNLADAYWDVDEKPKAKENYKTYVALMKSQGKDLSKIPQRVYERSK